ncbi:MAG: hemagglutinin repeat-containing protein, partial [Campylobacteraceae bacterium]|nr:hemagglutinin repeat-containing protein [Campylobacteraceae bacterium]
MKRILPIEIILSQSSANSGTYGFSAGITLDLKGNKKQTNTSTTTSLASNLTSNNLIINTSDNKDTTIQGSNVNVSNNALINTNNLNLLASEDTYTQDMKNKSVNASITIGMGGLSGDLGLGKDKTNTNKLNHNNTQLNVYNNLDLNINNDLNIKGANVLVKGKTRANINGDLNIVSLRDIEKTTSSSTSIGMSAGESGVSGANGGISVSKSTNKTVLTSSFITNESDIKVKGNTHLEGSVLASGTID